MSRPTHQPDSVSDDDGLRASKTIDEGDSRRDLARGGGAAAPDPGRRYHYTVVPPDPVTANDADVVTLLFSWERPLPVEAELEATLRSVPVSQWKVKQVLALDWDDGPVM